MFSLLLIGVILGAAKGANLGILKDGNLFIAGGQSTTISSRLYQVAIETRQTFACSGALIKPGIVLTVASCVDGVDEQDVAVRAGSNNRDNGGFTRNVQKIIVHPDFTISNDYDLAILKLEKPFDAKEAKTIRIANTEVKANDKVYLSGWGEDEIGFERPLHYAFETGKANKMQNIAIFASDASADQMTRWGEECKGCPHIKKVLINHSTKLKLPVSCTKNGKEGKLKKLQLVALDAKDCQNKYEDDLISPRMLCAWKDAKNAPCWNDFGDPLHNQWNALVGFYSWARNCDKYPSVYTNIFPLRDWIEQNSSK